MITLRYQTPVTFDPAKLAELPGTSIEALALRGRRVA